jgi:hypothetical protein
MDRYAHVGLKDTAEALDLLPGLPGTQGPTKSASVEAPSVEKLVPRLVPTGDVSCPELSPCGTDVPGDAVGGVVPKPLSFMEFGATCYQVTLLDMNSGGGTRTPDTRIMIPLAADRNLSSARNLGHEPQRPGVLLACAARHADPGLTLVIEQWAYLSIEARAAIIAIAQGREGDTATG